MGASFIARFSLCCYKSLCFLTTHSTQLSGVCSKSPHLVRPGLLDEAICGGDPNPTPHMLIYWGVV